MGVYKPCMDACGLGPSLHKYLGHALFYYYYYYYYICTIQQIRTNCTGDGTQCGGLEQKKVALLYQAVIIFTRKFRSNTTPITLTTRVGHNQCIQHLDSLEIEASKK